MADNWYIVLELEFDPPVEDEMIISQRIEEKSKFWSTHFNDFKYGAKYRTWYQNVPQIKKDMLGENNIRKQLSAEACTIVYAPIDKLLKAIGRKGSVSEEEGERLAQKLKTSIHTVKKRANKLGIIWDKSKINCQEVYEQYYKIKPECANTFYQIKQLLTMFNVDNLYDFLYLGTSLRNVNRLPCEILRQRAKEKKNNEFYKVTPLTSQGVKICTMCEIVFKDNEAKNVYDQCLRSEKTRDILEELKTIYEICGYLSNENLEDSFSALMAIYNERELVICILKDYCMRNKLPASYNWRENEYIDKTENTNYEQDWFDRYIRQSPYISCLERRIANLEKNKS